MKKYILIAIILFPGIFFSSCEFLEPEEDNTLTEDVLFSIPEDAEGILLEGYTGLPTGYTLLQEATTDDAVTNDFSSPYWAIANGQWSAQNDSASNWTKAYGRLYYINYFLKVKDGITWDFDSPEANALHLKRLTGEAYGLRAIYEMMLLQSHAGIATDGRLLGFPIVTKALTKDDDWKLPRNTFEECLNRIMTDLDSAILLLPENYVNIPGNDDHNEAMGSRWTNRLTAKAVKALKSRVLLFAASQAFNPTGDAGKWTAAASAAGNLLNENGGLAALSPTGLKFWVYPSGGPNDADVIWGTSIVSSSGIENQNFPPSLFGNGRVNPSQDLVNAFPMANGYPIVDASSNYDAANPYQNRDPRLDLYIVRDGSSFAGTTIRTYDGAPLDGLNEQTNSTRTGYYLRKLLLENVKIFPTVVEQNHFYTFARFTEILLNYAEAANEVWGPDVDGGGFGYTARQAIAAIRERAGITAPDPYLASLSSKEQLRTLIRNERRIELCFEGFRFYDIRRWNDKITMKAPVSGVTITQGTPNSYSYPVVEPRNYQDYMIYGPIPFNETLKYSELLQNQGW